MFRSLSPPALARAAASHPRRTLAIWAVVLVASLASVALLLPSATTSTVGFVNQPESAAANDLIKNQIGVRTDDTEMVVVTAPGGSIGDAANRARIDRLSKNLEDLGPSIVTRVSDPFAPGVNGLVSRDGTAALIPVTVAGDESTATDNIGKVLTVSEAADGSGLAVQVAGQAASAHDSNRTAESDLATGESIGIPVALIVLLVVFGTLVSALLPIGLAIVAIVVAMALTGVIGQAYPLSFFVTNMITMMGLAVGIDYVLFIVSRYREERARGSATDAAIAVASRTASRAVLFSGITVVVALVGLLIVPTTIFLSLALGAILVVIAAVAAAMTLLPAVLMLLGDRIEKGRVGRLVPSRLRRSSGEGGRFWPWAVGGVMRRPLISLLAVAGLLLLAAVPYLGIKTGASGVTSLPASAQSRQAYETMQREFNVGVLAPARIPLVGGPGTAGNRAEIAAIRRGIAGDPMFGQLTIEPGATAHGAVLDVPINADPNSTAATDAVTRLRSTTDLPVGGDAAQNLDYFNISANYQPIVFALVLSLSFLVLLIAFRSVVIPAVAIVMNLLSVGAAYGLLTLVAQDGHGSGIFGFQRVPVIEAWIPLFLFAVLFGLSMDYHVFLTSRIRERYEATGNTRVAVSEGITTSARLITGAALIMVAVFAGFASGQLVMFQEMGFGVAVAILIDATLVRTVLVPATMTLLGRWNWYLPSFLGWLPRVNVEGSSAEATSS
ncbi:MAG TPA: MMPL family transporter [Gaiellales bacterium]|nr:MMPL family transporter [Gaiellales bacterium]